jgi:hypothetical protein
MIAFIWYVSLSNDQLIKESTKEFPVKDKEKRERPNWVFSMFVASLVVSCTSAAGLLFIVFYESHIMIPTRRFQSQEDTQIFIMFLITLAIVSVVIYMSIDAFMREESSNEQDNPLIQVMLWAEEVLKYALYLTFCTIYTGAHVINGANTLLRVLGDTQNFLNLPDIQLHLPDDHSIDLEQVREKIRRASGDVVDPRFCSSSFFLISHIVGYTGVFCLLWATIIIRPLLTEPTSALGNKEYWAQRFESPVTYLCMTTFLQIAGTTVLSMLCWWYAKLYTTAQEALHDQDVQFILQAQLKMRVRREIIRRKFKGVTYDEYLVRTQVEHIQVWMQNIKREAYDSLSTNLRLVNRADEAV